MGPRSSAGQHRVHKLRSDEKAGGGGGWRGHVGSGPGSPGSLRVSRPCPTGDSRGRYARRKGRSHPFGAGAGSQLRLRPPGKAVVREKDPPPTPPPPPQHPRSLDLPPPDWLVLAVFTSFTLRFYYDLPNVRKTSLGCFRIGGGWGNGNTNPPPHKHLLGRSKWSSNSPAECAGSRLKDTPIRAIGGED